MAKNPLITDEIRRFILGVYLEHIDWPAKQIRDEVEVRLRGQNPQSKRGWPGLSAVQKELATIRKKIDEGSLEKNKLDRPWTLGCLPEYPILIDALPVIMDIHERRLRQPIGQFKPFTIRLALWISRIYKIIDDVTFLEAFAVEYAYREFVDWILDTTPFTIDLDTYVIKYRNNPSAFEWPEGFGAIHYRRGFIEKLKEKGYLLEKDGDTK